MKLLIASLLLVASVAADVSHLNNMYLPPQAESRVSEQYQQQGEYAEQTNEIPQVIGANTYTPEHLLQEPSNEVAAEETPDETILLHGGVYPQLREEDIRIDQQASEPAPATAEEPQQQPQEEEQQPAAQQFVPQTYGPSILFADIPEQGIFGAAQEQQQQPVYEAAASSGIDTQYGANGGYVY